MSEFVTYAEYLTMNSEIWQQGVMSGLMIIGTACLCGWMVMAVVDFFKMISKPES